MASSLLALVTQPRDAGGMGVSLPAAGIDPATLTALIVLALVFPLANLPTMRLLARFNTLGVLCVLLILAFSVASAAAAGVAPAALEPDALARPSEAGSTLGIFALSFFIHNCIITIFRAAAHPAHNQRNLTTAYSITWVCYAGMGVLAGLCPPLGNLAALRDTEIAGHSFLQVPQPGAMAGALLAARVAVVLQCVTVYPVLLYIVRAQFFTAFIYRKAYPGPLPVLLLSCLLAGCTTLVTVLRIPIATVLRFVGAIAALVCVYSLPVLVHAIESRRLKTLTPLRIALIVVILGFGVFSLIEQFL